MKHLFLTGDDFGRSHAVNEAIERQHEAGLLTQASLMVHEAHVDEAVRIARRHPGLCIGLHLTLCDGRASMPSALTDSRGMFAASPALAGVRYFFDPRTHVPLVREIEAQFARFRALGFPPTYFDGHTHLHLHPTIFPRAVHCAAGFQFVRLVREPRNSSPVALIFRALSAAAARQLPAAGLRAADRVYGLRDSGRLTTARIVQLLAHIPEGLSELYCHPGAEPAEFAPGPIREVLAAHGIELTSATRLSPPPQTAA